MTAATDPVFAGLARQAELIATGELSSRELTEAHLERIARLDPTLNAFRIVFAERALIEADQADGRRRGGDTRPLLGVPIAIKDDTDVAGEITAHGTSAYGEPAREDAEVVRRLRAAGAVIVGKTNVPELEIDAVHRVADVRRDPQPVGPQPDARRVQRRLGRRGGRGPGRRRARLRRRRLDPHPRRLLRAVRPQAPARPHPDGADAGAVARPLGLRHGQPPRRRHRALPRRRRRRRAAGARGRAAAGAAADRDLVRRHAADPGLARRGAVRRARRRRDAAARPRPRGRPGGDPLRDHRRRVHHALPARRRRRGRVAAAPRASLAPHQGLPPAGRLDPEGGARSGRAPRRRPTPARSPPSSSTPTC